MIVALVPLQIATILTLLALCYAFQLMLVFYDCLNESIKARQNSSSDSTSDAGHTTAEQDPSNGSLPSATKGRDAILRGAFVTVTRMHGLLSNNLFLSRAPY